MINFNHVGVTFPDIEAAVAWYVETLDFELLVPPVLREDITPGLRAVFGDRLQAMWMAHLQTANGVGLEMFSFVTPGTEQQEDPFEYWRTGPNHLCLTVDDLEATIARIEAAGGRARSGIGEPWPGRRFCYCEDPWGTQLELLTVSYETFVAGR